MISDTKNLSRVNNKLKENTVNGKKVMENSNVLRKQIKPFSFRRPKVQHIIVCLQFARGIHFHLNFVQKGSQLLLERGSSSRILFAPPGIKLGGD